MKVRELMQQRVLTIKDTDELALASQMMAWGGVRHLPVVREGRVVGVLSQRDIFAHVSQAGGRAAMQHQVVEAMSSPPQLAHPDDSVSEAIARMLELKLGCLPVVDRGNLVGIVTKSDVLADRIRSAFETPDRERQPVRSVMTRSPLVASPTDLLLDAAARMAHYRVRHLPVVDGDRRVVGILADRDVRMAVGDPERALDGRSLAARVQLLHVEDAMTRDVVMVREDEPIARAVGLLLDRRVGALPVVDPQGRIAGIVSYLDALRWMGERQG